MSKKKYAKYIVTEDVRPFNGPPPEGLAQRMEKQHAAGNFLDAFHLLGLNNRIVEGAPYFDAVWMTDVRGPDGFQVEIQHSHDFDEVLGFAGTYKGATRELDAEIEFWLEDEQFLLTQSALIYVPAGMNHLPLYFRKINSPVLFFTFANRSSYTRETGNE